ncbi:transporter substrate-binding domain-containing protein [Skermania sp. ID1734]|uniref:ABC transporter substrate-binding protein n=1 Tax=Skermania sp. ID1734 TaxID=2597516 RepID=UPI002107A7FD|nr:transporter substrate-binding domain-containing protein [Skermania sp. ID1734]
MTPIAAAKQCGPTSNVGVTPGVLTIATDKPAYSPWFFANDPSNGKGFEGAVAQRVAELLGYGKGQLRYVSVPFAQALQPGDKQFDFDVNEFTIDDSRRANVDFSSPYYTVAQAVVAMKGNPAAQAKALAGLSGLRLGALADSTSMAAIVGTLRPKVPPRTYTTNDEAKNALAAGQIDALIVDLPTGFQIVTDQLPNSVLVGQFSRTSQATDHFGLVLQKNSPMTQCVSAAIDSLYADGTLDLLAHQWLADTAGARVLD